MVQHKGAVIGIGLQHGDEEWVEKYENWSSFLFLFFETKSILFDKKSSVCIAFEETMSDWCGNLPFEAVNNDFYRIRIKVILDLKLFYDHCKIIICLTKWYNLVSLSYKI